MARQAGAARVGSLGQLNSAPSRLISNLWIIVKHIKVAESENMDSRGVIGIIPQVFLPVGFTLALASLAPGVPGQEVLIWAGACMIVAGVVSWIYLLVTSQAKKSNSDRYSRDSAEIKVGKGSQVISRNFHSNSGRRFIEAGDNAKIDVDETDIRGRKK